MAARLKPRHQEDIKIKIQGVHLALMLQEHALEGFYNGVELSPTRIDAAKFLLNKIISNAVTEIAQTTEISGTLEVSKRPKLNREEWLASLVK